MFKIDKNNLPKTLFEAIELIVRGLNAEEIEFIKSQKDAGLIHHTVGM